MKRFLAVYMGTAAARSSTEWDKVDASQRQQIQAKGMQAWMEWGTANAAAIVDQGAPLGKTKRASKQGIADFKNALTGYVIVQAESHAAGALATAAKSAIGGTAQARTPAARPAASPAVDHWPWARHINEPLD